MRITAGNPAPILGTSAAGTPERITSTDGALDVSASHGVKDENNSSQATLSGGAAFTGAWTVTHHQHVGFNVLASHDGTIYLEFGIVDDDATIASDGTVDPSDVTTTFSDDEPVYANVAYFRTGIDLPGRAYRIRYVNGATPQTSFRLHTATGSALFPASASPDGEVLITETERERNVFSAYGPGAITSDGTTWACLVDLSDTSNWPHDRTGRIDISIINMQVDKTTNCTGSVSLGVITRVDATNADVTLFAGISFNNASETHLEVSRNFAPSQLKCGVSGGVATRIVTTAKLTNDTGIQTDVAMASHRGAGTVTPAVGDIVVRFIKTAGTSMTPAVQVFYHGERST